MKVILMIMIENYDNSDNNGNDIDNNDGINWNKDEKMIIIMIITTTLVTKTK